MSEQKKQWIGWILTIVLAVIAAVGTSSGRISTMENKCEENEKKIDKIENCQQKQNEKINEKLDRLLIEVTELRIEIKHKKDR